jgi:hypothetical protein
MAKKSFLHPKRTELPRRGSQFPRFGEETLAYNKNTGLVERLSPVREPFFISGLDGDKHFLT